MELSVLQDQVTRLSRALSKTHDDLVCRDEEVAALQKDLQVRRLGIDVPRKIRRSQSLWRLQSRVTVKIVVSRS